ncbi:MAG: CrcB family protein [Frankia sp.]|nr:CrcB family protein [Frankia sp.]
MVAEAAPAAPPPAAGPRRGRRARPASAGGLLAVLAVVAAGGVVGACLRYGAQLAWPTPPGGFPWATFAVNTAGAAAIGALTALLDRLAAPHPLARPFLVTGILGGFTTFSAYAVDGYTLLDGGHPATALAYLAGTVAAALAAVTAAATATRRALARAAGRRR